PPTRSSRHSARWSFPGVRSRGSGIRQEPGESRILTPDSRFLTPDSRCPMAIPGQLNPTPRLLLGPGPCDVHPRVLSAMTTPLLGHLDPQFLDIMTETQEMLR